MLLQHIQIINKLVHHSSSALKKKTFQVQCFQRGLAQTGQLTNVTALYSVEPCQKDPSILSYLIYLFQVSYFKRLPGKRILQQSLTSLSNDYEVNYHHILGKSKTLITLALKFHFLHFSPSTASIISSFSFLVALSYSTPFLHTASGRYVELIKIIQQRIQFKESFISRSICILK